MLGTMLLAVSASTCLSIGLFLMKRAARALPSLKGGWYLPAWVAFARDGQWMLGLLLQIVGYVTYLVALRVAPLNVVHTALNGGIALFVILAVVGLGEQLRWREWLGLGILTGALLVLSASFVSVSGPSLASPSSATGALPFSFVLLAASGLAIGVDRSAQRPIGLSVAAGLVLGLASVYAKELALTFSARAAALVVATNLIGFALMQGSLQVGRGVVVMPLFSMLSNVVPIVGGLLVFHEPLPAHGAAAVLRPLAITLAIVGAALLAGFGQGPAPRSANVSHAEETSAE